MKGNRKIYWVVSVVVQKKAGKVRNFHCQTNVLRDDVYIMSSGAFLPTYKVYMDKRHFITIIGQTVSSIALPYVPRVFDVNTILLKRIRPNDGQDMREDNVLASWAEKIGLEVDKSSI